MRQRTLWACPRCGGRDRFSIHLAKQVFNCRVCGGKGRGAISLTQFLDSSDFRTAVEALTGERHVSIVPAAKQNDADDDRNRRYALELWSQARAPAGTPVETYLARRGLRPPSSDAVRFHVRCPFGRDARGRIIYTPAMIALVRDIVSNEPLAIHRTALARDGTKVAVIGPDGKPTDRRTLGATRGGAIKLTADADVSNALGVGEGIETTLSLQHLPEWRDSPVWSLLSKQGVRDFPTLAGVETLMIAVDNDAERDGEKAAAVLNARWRAAGREVLLAYPNDVGADINDVVRAS